MSVPKQHNGSSCLLTLFISGAAVVLAFGAVSMVGLNFIPGLTIQPAQNVSLVEILKMAGGGLLVSLLGLVVIWGGFKSVLTRQAALEDERGRYRVRNGCSAVLLGIFQSLLGFLLLLVGTGLIALSLYQQILPWLGIIGITVVL